LCLMRLAQFDLEETFSFLNKRRSCGAIKGYASSQSYIQGNVGWSDHATARCVVTGNLRGD
ncbi:hypothetical protein, partial [Paraburkholderia sediminicola]|uniref:hypothetical protein n=1 Tax=Paraburkholderia sediminicola TaxID=458836 RepID=UPI0038B8ABCC